MLQIREFLPQDRERYIAMSQDFYAGAASLHGNSRENIEASFDAVLAGSPLLRGVILEQAGEMVGYALLCYYYSCERGGRGVWLDELYLAAHCRGQGLGRQFLEWMTAEYGGSWMRLEVCPQNPRAKKLYESCGFAELPYIQMVREP